jgi:hypothetical protein
LGRNFRDGLSKTSVLGGLHQMPQNVLNRRA